MALPDFSQAIDFIRLREQLGATVIPEVPPVRFERVRTERKEIVENDSEDEELLEKLRSTVEVSAAELSSDGRGLLTYRGRKVVAYIRDQRREIDEINKTSSYRYHLADCSTMQSMRHAGRERRYLATQRSDGLFEVNYRTGWGQRRRAEVRLELCKNCRDELPRGVYQEPFSLKRYFEEHDSQVPRTVRRIETVEEVQEYQPTQADLSREFKKAVNYRCQACSVDCSDQDGLLHLHHVDGDPSNNAHHNLRVLCIDCHSRQPYHTQVSLTARAREQIEQVRRFRRLQGIAELTVQDGDGVLMHLLCPRCGTTLRYRLRANAHLRCPSCNHSFTV